MLFSPLRKTSSATRTLKSLAALTLTISGLLTHGTHAATTSTVPLQTVTLGWNAVSATGIQGYKVYAGTQSKQYTLSYNAGTQLAYPVTGLASGQTYYFAVTALGSTGLESAYSSELAVTIPLPPVAVADAYSATQNVALVIQASGVLANDTDPQSIALSAVLDTVPSHGSVSLGTNGGFTYTPATGYTGSDAFTYHANNGKLDSNVVTVNLTVNPATLGSLVNGSFESDYTGWTASGNQSVQSTGIYVATDGSKLVAFNGGDTTPNGVLSQTFATTAGQTYTLTFDAGVLAYNKNQQVLQMTLNGTSSLLSQSITLTGLGGGATRWYPQSFTFVANSPSTTLTFLDKSTKTLGLDLLVDKVSLKSPTITGNTAPVAATDNYTTPQNTALVISPTGVLANDTDAQSTPLTSILDVGPSHGTVTLNSNGGFTYTPTSGYSGADSFTYRANDGSLNSNIATVNLTVSPSTLVTLVNGSFETDFTSWTTSGNLSIQSAGLYKATDGSKLVAFNSGDTTPNGVLAQTFATTVGKTYTLTFDAGVLAYNKNSQKLLVTVTGLKTLISSTVTLIGTGGGATLWVPQSFTFVADKTQTILTFKDQSTTSSSLDLLLDKVRVVVQGLTSTL